MDKSSDPLVLKVIPLPVVIQTRHAHIVREGFWAKLLKLAGHVPFAEDLAAAYFCVVDPKTPSRVRGVLLFGLAWFVVPATVMPEFLIVLGLTDDAAIIALMLGLVRKHIKERHYRQAREALGIPEPEPDADD